MSGSGVYEFVVVGEIGPLLRSMLIDMSIEDRPVQTCLRFTTDDDAELLPVLAAATNRERQLERIRVDD
jgi:hypothetical protein